MCSLILTSLDFISPTDSSKSKVLRKKKSRWGNEKVELPAILPHIPTPVHIPTLGVGAPGVANRMQLGPAAVVKSSVPCKCCLLWVVFMRWCMLDLLLLFFFWGG